MQPQGRLRNDKAFILTWAFVTTTVVFLWISATALGPQPASRPVSEALLPSARAALHLRDYGSRHGINLVSPATQTRPNGLPARDSALVDELEAQLEQARTSLSSLEEGSASALLSRVESQLFAHPYLPQASFLMAECLALRARAARERSPALAEQLEARRAALEGPRSPEFGEAPLELAPAPRSPVAIEGLAAGDALEVDGEAHDDAAPRLELSPGLHHVRVLRRGRVVFASFTEVIDGQQALTLAVPSIEPCSAEDLVAAITDPLPRVACPRWMKVRDEPPGIGVALCEHETCGAFVHWQRPAAAPFTPLAPERRGMPGWVGFAIATVTVAATGTLVLWQAGAFEHGRPSAARWEYGGLDPQALRF